jgi:hypothetical protein
MALLSLLFGMSLAISISGSLALGALLFTLTLVRAIRQKNGGGSMGFLEAMLVALFAWTTLSSVVAHASNIFEILSWQSAFLVFFLAARFLRDGELKKACAGFAAAAGVAGLWGFIQKFTGVQFDPNVPVYHVPAWCSGWPIGFVRYLAVNIDRAQGPRSHPLTYAETLMPALLLVSYQLILCVREKKQPKNIAILMGAFLAMAAGLVASQSRGVWLGTTAGLLVLIFALPIKPRLVIFASGLLAIGVLLTTSSLYRHRALSIFSLQAGRISDRQSREIRVELWRQSIDRIKEKPVLGWGLKQAVLHTIDPVFNKPRTWTESHDIFLQTAMECGLVGLVFFLLILAASGKLVFKRPPPESLLLGAILIAFVIAGLTESWTRDKEVALVFWGFIGYLARREF